MTPNNPLDITFVITEGMQPFIQSLLITKFKIRVSKKNENTPQLISFIINIGRQIYHIVYEITYAPNVSLSPVIPVSIEHCIGTPGSVDGTLVEGVVAVAVGALVASILNTSANINKKRYVIPLSTSFENMVTIHTPIITINGEYNPIVFINFATGDGDIIIYYTIIFYYYVLDFNVDFIANFLHKYLHKHLFNMHRLEKCYP
jgi:hypothetical protein